jgi:CBS domain containing-hemolysin-like protein
MPAALQSFFLVLFALFLVFLNGFFVAAEFAIVKVRSTRIEELAARGTFGAKKAQEAVRHLDSYLSATQLGITLASLGLGYIGEPAFAHLLEPTLGWLPERIRPAAVAGIVAFTLITALHIVLGELVPKSLAIQKAEKITLAVIYPLDFFYRLFRAPIVLLNGVASLVLRPFGVSPAGGHEGSEPHSEDELRMIISASRQGGELKESEYTIVNRVFDFAQQQAKEIMVPRLDVVFLSTDWSIAENVRVAEESGFTRFPLMEDGSQDDVVGMIHIKDLLALSRQEGTATEDDAARLRRIARDMIRVPETKQIDQMLRDFQRGRQHMAVIVDEYGGTAGIVTLEDIVEEIIGDIHDEFDRTAPELEPVGEDCYSVDARMSLAKLERALNIAGPAEETEVDTIGGWVMAERGSGTIRLGDIVAYGEATVTVTELAGRRVRKVKVCIPERDTPERSPVGTARAEQ